MMNNLLGVIALAALVGTVALAPAPEPEAMSRAVASRPIPADPAVVSYALPARQPPIPVVRSGRASTATSPEVTVHEAEAKPQDGLERTAAKTAIEADGYKGVTVLGQAAEGTWQARAFRGTTEVQLIVDSTGRVSAR